MSEHPNPGPGEQQAPQADPGPQQQWQQAGQHPRQQWTQPPYASQPPGQYRRLVRPSWDSPISGVCGGLALYFGIDPTLVRVLAVVAAFFTFPVGLIVYAVLWAVIPKV